MENLSEIIKKYNKSIPRYTSYPTALEFKPTEEKNFIHSLSQIEGDVSLYIHIPFCKSQCYFCGCNMLVSNISTVHETYVRNLCKEIKRVNYLRPKLKVTQLHFGGGTPSILSNSLFQEIMNTIHANFSFTERPEISLEAHPMVMSSQQVSFLKTMGFNRLSLGLQDFDENVQTEIRRIQDFKTTQNIVDAARTEGFSSINIDLVYGLPKQTLESFKQTLIKVNQLSPDRIALYSFAFVPWIKPYQKFFSMEDFPETEEKLEIFLEAKNFFLDNGYEAIGIDHFAKKTDELYMAQQNSKLYRNFMGYTLQASNSLIGLGTSSISELPNGYFQNEKKLVDYYKKIQDGLCPVSKSIPINHEDRLRKQIIMDIMCNHRIDIASIEEKFHLNFQSHFKAELESLHHFKTEGFLEQKKEEFLLTNNGKILSRNIAHVFDQYSKNNPNSFSRAI